MIQMICALLAGLVFGFGLIISEMVNPKRVRGFLDISNNWDPTMVFVMIGALLVAGIGFKIAFFRAKPLFAASFTLPTLKVIDHRLITGAMLFGTGWGISGLCPGPAIVGLSTLNYDIVVFIVAMVVGMKAFELVGNKEARDK